MSSPTPPTSPSPSSSPKSTHSSSIFFTLPPELRLMIYTLVLRKPRPIILHPRRSEVHPRVRNQPLTLPRNSTPRTINTAITLLNAHPSVSPSPNPHISLLLVSRLLNQEATPALCASNLVILPSASALLSMPLNSQYTLLTHLRHVALFIRFDWSYRRCVTGWPSALYTLYDCAPALRSVGLYFENTGHWAEMQTLRLYWGLDGGWDEEWVQGLIEDLSRHFEVKVGFVDSPANIEQV